MKASVFATTKQLSSLSQMVQSQGDHLTETQETCLFIKEHMATKGDLQELRAEIHSEFATKQELAKTQYDILDHIDRTRASKEDLLLVKQDLTNSMQQASKELYESIDRLFHQHRKNN